MKTKKELKKELKRKKDKSVNAEVDITIKEKIFMMLITSNMMHEKPEMLENTRQTIMNIIDKEYPDCPPWYKEMYMDAWDVAAKESPNIVKNVALSFFMDKKRSEVLETLNEVLRKFKEQCDE